MTKVYVGLDTATITGVAIWMPKTHRALVSQVKGTPIEQLIYIKEQLEAIRGEVVVVMEQMHYFRNAKTIRSLVERYGYLKYTLLEAGYRVEEVAPRVARSHFGAAGKEEMFRLFMPYFDGTALTSNHTDALAVALKQACDDGENFNLEALEIL